MDDGSVRFCWFPSTGSPPRRLKLCRYYGCGQRADVTASVLVFVI